MYSSYMVSRGYVFVCVCVCVYVPVWCTTRNTEHVKSLYKTFFRKLRVEFFNLNSISYIKFSSIVKPSVGRVAQSV